MAARKTRDRLYDSADLRRLMNDANARLRDWNDVIDRLENPARHESSLSSAAATQLKEDVIHLRDHDLPFSADYRTLWKELTGESADEPYPQPNPAQLEDRMPGDTESFNTEDVVHSAESQSSSSRVLDVLQRVESKEYKEIAAMIEASGEAGWERAR